MFHYLRDYEELSQFSMDFFRHGMASVPGTLDINLAGCFKPFHFERKIFHATKKAFLITLMARERMDFYLIDNSRLSCSEHIQFVAEHINNFHNEAFINFLGSCCQFPQEPISMKWWIRHFPQRLSGKIPGSE